MDLMRIREPADITAALAASIENGGLLLDETQLGEMHARQWLTYNPVTRC